MISQRTLRFHASQTNFSFKISLRFSFINIVECNARKQGENCEHSSFFFVHKLVNVTYLLLIPCPWVDVFKILLSLWTMQFPAMWPGECGTPVWPGRHFTSLWSLIVLFAKTTISSDSYGQRQSYKYNWVCCFDDCITTMQKSSHIDK